MRTVEQLISMSRDMTGNQRFDSNSGSSQRIFVQYLQNAQDSLVTEINNAHSKFFKKTETVTVVSGQEKYDYPTDCIIQQIDTIQWLQNLSGSSYFRTLELCIDKERVNIQPAYPFGYIPENDGYVLNPPITNGFLKVTYLATVLRAQKKSGKVKFVNFTTGNVLSSIGLDINDPTWELSDFSDEYYFTIVNKLGTIKASNVPFNSINQAGIFNLDPVALGTSETIAAGDFVLVGRNVTNVPQFPDLCESYLLKYMNYMAKLGDSSSWSDKVMQDMEKTFASIVSLFASKTTDDKGIPITNLDFLSM